jgi:hypothetical protein
MSHKPLVEDPPVEDDLVPEDDAVIGQAFRRSLWVLLGIGAVVAAVVLLRPKGEQVEVVREKDAGAIADLESDAAVLPEVRFSDVTGEWGLNFMHESGAQGGKYLPETMGGGAAFFDCDADGDQDLFLVSSAAGGVGALYKNEGGRYADATAAAGIAPDARIAYGMGAAVGDYDADGHVDLLLTGVGGNRLLRNTGGGAFEDVTAAAGVGTTGDQWTTAAGFFDYDRDGDLDLFVGHYVKWTRAIDERLAFTLNGTDRAYGPPTNYEGQFSSLYRNEGDGSFEDVSAAAGIQVTNPATGAPMGKALGLSFADFDGNGFEDVFVANDTVQNHLFLNRGDGTFEERGRETGSGFDGNGRATGAMGMDLADFRCDGGLGVGIANFANEMTSLYVKSAAPGFPRFTDDAMGEGIGSPSRGFLKFGLFFFDYDLDGRQDLLQVNGHLEETINEVQPSQTYLQPPQLFWNAGPSRPACFMEVPRASTGGMDRQLAGRGSCYADIDADGDQDVLMMQVGRAPVLLRNDQALGHHWLRVRLEGLSPNRGGLGAWVSLKAGGALQRQRVSPTKSYLSQSELPLTFGLGTSTSIDSIEVLWPDGTRQSVAPPAELDRELVIRHEG